MSRQDTRTGGGVRDPGAVMGGLVPPPVAGSAAAVGEAPADALRPAHATALDGETVWWRPGLGDVARVLGWRWLPLLALLAVGVGLPILAFAFPWYRGAGVLRGAVKLYIVAIAAAVSIFTWGIKNAVKARKDPFCIHCGFSVEGLGEAGRCPECGREFSLAVIAEFKKDPHFFAERHRLTRLAPSGAFFRAGDGPTPDDGTR